MASRILIRTATRRNCILMRALPRLQSRAESTESKPPQVDVAALLEKPSWSVKEYLFKERPSIPIPSITKEQLHHLLRLSALPLPKSEEQEAKMIKDLQAQLSFVQAIQEVDTEGVEPLQMIRDETEEAELENTVTMETLKDEFAKEEVVGRRGRIRKKAAVKEEQPGEDAEKWNPLAHASKTQGPYFVVNTVKD